MNSKNSFVSEIVSDLIYILVLAWTIMLVSNSVLSPLLGIGQVSFMMSFMLAFLMHMFRWFFNR